MSDIHGGTDVLERTEERSAPPVFRRPRATKPQLAVAAGLAVVGLIVVAIVLGGGGGGSPSTGGESAGGGGVASAVPMPAEVAPGAATAGGSVTSGSRSSDATAGSTASGPVQVPSAVPPVPGSKVVKTGEMDLQVDKGEVGHMLDRLTAIATLERGFVADTHSSEAGDASGSVTLRIPVANFEDTLTQVRKLPAKVTSVQVAGQDVTSQYVDLKARLAALSDTRTAFERLLGQATTIGQTLEVQSHITDIQTQIEQLQGQIRVLDDQTSYGTLTVTVDQPAKVTPVAHHRSGMSAAVHRSVTRFVNGIEAIIGVLGPLLLVLLIVGVVLLGGRLVYRLVRRQLA